jgi:hypothetical protein
VSKFVSQTPDCPTFDDKHPAPKLSPEGAYVPRDYAADPLGSFECGMAGAVAIIPRDEWKERIQEKEAKQQRGLPPLHQESTWSCWSQAVTDNAHFVQSFNGGPVVRLSTGSVAGPVKRYRKKGGNCSEAIKRMATHGICSADKWPENDYKTNRWDDETAANAALHKVLEYDDLEPHNFDEMISLLLQPKPRTVAYCNWAMSHAVLAIDAIINERGEFGVLTRNSGLYRDKQGFTKFFGKFSIPNDACSIRTMLLNARPAA